MLKSIPVLAALALASAVAAPAAAEETSVAVTYADLDLTSPAGAKTLEERIDTAVEAVCEKPAIRDLKAMVAWEECKAAARAGVHDQLSVLDRYETLALAN